MIRNIAASPLYVNWNYTNKCNFNCMHCYSRSENGYDDEPNTNDYKKIADTLIKNKVFQVNLGGGEPTLREDFLEISSHLAKNGVMVNLSTNGWMITKQLSQQLDDCNINVIYLSLDHIDPLKHDKFRAQEGSYQKVVEAISVLKEHNHKIRLSTVVTQLNLDVMEQIVDFAEKKGLNGVDFKRMRLNGNGLLNAELLQLDEDQEKQMYTKIKALKSSSDTHVNLAYQEEAIKGLDDGCPCGKKSIAIKVNGDIAPCVYSSVVIGNILKDDLSKIWKESSVLQRLRNNFSCMGIEQDEINNI